MKAISQSLRKKVRRERLTPLDVPEHIDGVCAQAGVVQAGSTSQQVWRFQRLLEVGHPVVRVQQALQLYCLAQEGVVPHRVAVLQCYFENVISR